MRLDEPGRQAGRHSGREGRREEGGMGRKGGRWGGEGNNIKRNARGALAQKKVKSGISITVAKSVYSCGV